MSSYMLLCYCPYDYNMLPVRKTKNNIFLNLNKLFLPFAIIFSGENSLS